MFTHNSLHYPLPLTIPVPAMRTDTLLGLTAHGFHKIFYTDWGDSTNERVVICVHGLTRNCRDFDFLAQALANECRVVCPDVAGRGGLAPRFNKKHLGKPPNKGVVKAVFTRPTAPPPAGGVSKMLVLHMAGHAPPPLSLVGHLVCA